ncbi:hypothetical protein ANAPC1_01163 [Anaplasma phagocytophilum]|uniref:Uncharacterized protein n=1 Tax=Anaplasma phagocytophilum TaxID=948 RepID=A0AA45UTV9_ANAPH|nr:hypothetical protein ANAPC1_01163 [Anaplasma phagocytophilum]
MLVLVWGGYKGCIKVVLLVIKLARSRVETSLMSAKKLKSVTVLLE